MDVLEELDRAGAVLLDRHFVYKSKKHGSGYINLDPLFPNVGLVSKFCSSLVGPFAEDGIQTIAAPAVGGIVLAVLAAKSLDTGWGKESPAAIWADKDGDDFVFERAGFIEHLTGKRVLVVEDLLTTGGSVLKVCREAEKQGAEIAGVSVICNRGDRRTVGSASLGSARQRQLRGCRS
jgi:orotate phosphoribosyltransferase